MPDDLSLGEIGRTVTRVEAKVDRALADHESRLRRVEAWMYALPVAVLTAIASAVVAVAK